MPRDPFKWGDPPPIKKFNQRGKTAGKYEPILNKLATKPGMWARIWTGKPSRANGLAGQLRKGALSMGMHTARDFEFTVRKTGKGTAAVYGRFVWGRMDRTERSAAAPKIGVDDALDRLEIPSGFGATR